MVTIFIYNVLMSVCLYVRSYVRETRYNKVHGGAWWVTKFAVFLTSSPNIVSLQPYKKELETITLVRETLTRMLENAREQQVSNKEAKHQLEMDWSDKVIVNDSLRDFPH